MAHIYCLPTSLRYIFDENLGNFADVNVAVSFVCDLRVNLSGVVIGNDVSVNIFKRLLH